MTEEINKDTAEELVSERKRRKRRTGFLPGLVCGVLLAFAAIVLITGRIAIPFGRFGTLTITLPYYSALHPGDRLDTAEINRKMNEINQLIDYSYLYKADPEMMTNGIFAGMVYGLTDDNYAEYYSAKRYAQEQKELDGSYEGIGVLVRKDEATGGILVIGVNSLGPAKEAGIEVDDLIIAADGTDVREMTLEEAISGHITGPAGTSVKLTILRGDVELEIDVMRQLILDITVRDTVIPDTNIGYLSITSFNRTTESEFKESVDRLTEQKVDGVIIDLRNNGGGDMNVAIRMLDYLLADNLEVKAADGSASNGKGTLLLTIESKTGNSVYMASDNHEMKLPIVVLVNGNSASASEIFTGVLMDYGCRSVGEKTYGKGVVQSLYTLSDRSAVKFTTAQYRLPGGDLIHGIGITPDVEAEFVEFDDVTGTRVNYAGGDETDLVKDTQVQAALKLF